MCITGNTKVVQLIHNPCESQFRQEIGAAQLESTVKQEENRSNKTTQENQTRQHVVKSMRGTMMSLPNSVRLMSGGYIHGYI